MRLSGKIARAAVMVALAAVAVAGCGGGGTPEATPTQMPDPVKTQLAAVAGVGVDSTVLTATGNSVAVYAAPGAPGAAAATKLRLANPNQDGAKLVFLVTAKMPGWWQVLLPVQPNGSTGWVKAEQVTASSTPYRIVVSRGQHTLTLYKSGVSIAVEKVAIGTSDTPTPGGRFYLAELLKPPNPNGPYGPYAFGLNGFSTTLDSFEGQDPVIGLHGTNQPQMLGQDVSHGCIRLSNDAITRLAGTVPTGTPVDIIA
ncbi:L,D-transpeptidase [Pseudofrankia asymbiotica]|uniref:L,D-transpeptidase n=1 Tax=Pseudofrankia asymbiotica TaxID=1834516 RepID=A0A1V2I870_9ACTN|nr:L,D-transpeptidase [Pseudofrankia asymbiotica]ONH26808.1 L,D-transpeptidase [Pseudofrankia asymbiotica]